MPYPIPARWRVFVFWPLLVATLVLMVLMSGPLKTQAAPLGIISFELAGDAATAREIVESWDAEARRAADLNLRLDFLYLIAYSTTIGVACAWAADVLRARGWRSASIGVPLAWAQWLAALFDAVENVALLRMLHGPVENPWPQIAAVCATIKFLLVGAGLAYTMAGAVAWLGGRLSRGAGSFRRRPG